MVKMYINSYQSIHTLKARVASVLFCLFFTISCPINAISASFNVLVFCDLHVYKEDKGRAVL